MPVKFPLSFTSLFKNQDGTGIVRANTPSPARMIKSIARNISSFLDNPIELGEEI